MPTLTREQYDRMQEKAANHCSDCDRTVRQNYCQSCDEFYEIGHARNCPTVKDGANDHDGRGHHSY